MARPFALIVGALIAIACSGTAPSPATTAADGPTVPIACMGLEEPDCTRVFEAATADMAPDDEVVYAEVGPFGCPVDTGCANTLAARPSGQVVFERPTGDPLTVSVTAAADGSITTGPGEWMTVAVTPSSTAGQLGAGPIRYHLGHCGLMSGVDVDGSWWDPVGFVDIDHADSINETNGSFAPTGPNDATYTSDGGFSVSLVRRIGQKHLPLCM